MITEVNAENKLKQALDSKSKNNTIQAIKSFRELLFYYKQNEVTNISKIAMIIHELATLHMSTGSFEKAKYLLEESITLRSKLGLAKDLVLAEYKTSYVVLLCKIEKY